MRLGWQDLGKLAFGSGGDRECLWWLGWAFWSVLFRMLIFGVSLGIVGSGCDFALVWREGKK